MKNYYCVDENTGEEFIVEADTKGECQEVFKKWGFTDAYIICTISDFEAECCGLDTY